MTSAEDLASRPRAFASDAIVVKHIIEFALPSKKRANAPEVTPKATSAVAASANTIKNRGAATEHTVCMDETQDAENDAPQPQVEHKTEDDDPAPAATDITAHSTSDATELATKQKRRLKKHDDRHQTDSVDVTLKPPQWRVAKFGCAARAPDFRWVTPRGTEDAPRDLVLRCLRVLAPRNARCPHGRPRH